MNIKENSSDYKKFWRLVVALAFVLIVIVLLDVMLWHARNTAIQESTKTSLSGQDTLVPQQNSTEEDKAHIFTAIQTGTTTASSSAIASTSLVATLKKGAQLSDEDKMKVFKSFHH